MAVYIKSLRIGSHVEYNGKRAMVYDMSAKMNTPDYLVMIYQDGRFTMVPLDELSPISITSELLRELGFKSKHEGCWQHWWQDGFDLQHRDESEYWHFHGDIGLEYLHELESLYYMIYGVELIKD